MAGPIPLRIADRVLLFFAEERRPMLVRHLVLGLALLPIPWLRIGALDILFTAMTFAPLFGLALGFGIIFFLSAFSVPLIPLFLAWSLPGAGRVGLPRRSIVFLALLIVYHPFRLYLEGVFHDAETLATIARLHEQFPVVWVVKHLDTPLLMGLLVWAIRGHRTARPVKRLWFHWLLFVGGLWAVCSFLDFGVGDSLWFFVE